MTSVALERDDNAHSDTLVGRMLAGKFQIEALLNAGAMGAIYRAHHIALDKTICVKVMHRELAREPSFARRFHREACAASRLDHRSSVHILDFGEEHETGTHYIAMEFLDGRDLFELLQDEAPLPTTRIIDLMSQMLGALAAAHDVGVLHRDLKPENIMVVNTHRDDGTIGDLVKVCDFGIAKLSDATSSANKEEEDEEDNEIRRSLTTKGLIIGTPEYMSPEQARGSELDARSDIYAAGILLYQMLAGCVPFSGESPIAIALQQIERVPPPPSSIRSSVHPVLEAVCLRALQKNPSDRPSSAREMRAMLQRALSDSNPDFARASASSLPTLAEHEIDVDVEVEVDVDIAADDDDPINFVLPRRTIALPIAFVLGVIVAVAAIVGVNRWRANDHAAMVERASIATAPLPTIFVADEAPPPATIIKPLPSPTPTERTITPPPPPPPRSVARRTTTTTPSPPPKAIAEPAPEIVSPASPVQETTETPSIVEPAPTPAPTTPPPPAAAPAAAAPAAATPPPYVIDKARVEMGAPIRVAGATSSGFQRALAPTAQILNKCYRAALPTLAVLAESSHGALVVETNDVGVITRAKLNGPLRPALGACVEHGAIGGKVANVDTGIASAEIPLTFHAR